MSLQTTALNIVYNNFMTILEALIGEGRVNRCSSNLESLKTYKCTKRMKHKRKKKSIYTQHVIRQRLNDLTLGFIVTA